MPYQNVPVAECIREFLLYGLCYRCDGDSQSVVLAVEDVE